jgi:hypothetical protein
MNRSCPSVRWLCCSSIGQILQRLCESTVPYRVCACHLLTSQRRISEREGVEFDQKIHFYLAEGLLRTIAVQSDRKSNTRPGQGVL